MIIRNKKKFGNKKETSELIYLILKPSRAVDRDTSTKLRVLFVCDALVYLNVA